MEGREKLEEERIRRIPARTVLRLAREREQRLLVRRWQWCIVR